MLGWANYFMTNNILSSFNLITKTCGLLKSNISLSFPKKLSSYKKFSKIKQSNSHKHGDIKITL